MVLYDTPRCRRYTNCVSVSSYFSFAPATPEVGGMGGFRARRGLELVVDFLADGRMFWPCEWGYVEEAELATSGDDDFVPMGVTSPWDSPPGDAEDSG